MLEQQGWGQVTKLLLVSAKPTAQQDLEAALRGWEGSCQISWVYDLANVLPRARDEEPHIILVDVGPADVHAIGLIRELASSARGSVILALVEGLSLDQANQAVLAGARGFVTSPMLPGPFQLTLRQALEEHGSNPARLQRKAERLIVFCGLKGGVGRTTLAMNTAVSLHRTSKESVVLVDADYWMPALDVTLNLRSERSLADLLGRLSQLDEDLVSGVLAHHACGLKVLLAPPPSRDGAHPVAPHDVQQVLAVLQKMFPWVVVDMGIPMDETAYAYLDGADRIVVCAIPEMSGLRNTRRMLDQLHGRGYPEEKVWLMLNRANARGAISVADIRQRLGMSQELTHLVPDNPALVALSINRGVPLVLTHHRSDVGRAVSQFVQRLIDDFPAPKNAEAAGAHRGWRGRSGK